MNDHAALYSRGVYPVIMTMPSPWMTLPLCPVEPLGQAKAPTGNLLPAAFTIGMLPAEVWSAMGSRFWAKSERADAVGVGEDHLALLVQLTEVVEGGGRRLALEPSLLLGAGRIELPAVRDERRKAVAAGTG